ncbi:glycosyltransferase family 4 protein, partial [Streptomyces sp. T-3]|nr:glycosyltransferase family 4 protein [Streptomyces sp. T-3]
NLLLRRRGTEPRDEIRIPLPVPGDRPAGSHLAVEVDRAAHRLAEGRWDCYVEHPADGKRRRIVAELVEQQHLLTLPLPPVGGGEVGHWIPYATTDGHLALRTWLRAGHAEVTAIEPGAYAFQVTATLHGTADPGEPIAVVARGRSGEYEPHDFEVQARRAPSTGAGAGAGAGVAAGPAAITFEIPYALANASRAGGHDLWDLQVVPSPGDAPIRLARIAGDRVSRKKTDVFAATTLDPAPGGPVCLRPYFTVDNNLALSARPLASHEGLSEEDLAFLDQEQDALHG